VILAPYTLAKRSPRALRALTEHIPAGQTVEWREIDPGDDRAYSRILVEAWAEPGDLVIVEHDVGIRAGVIEELQACRQPWCGFPYPIGEQLIVCLGCTKFSAHLKASLPGLMADAAGIGEEDGGGVPAGHWCRMDIRIAACLERLGHNRHRHEPAVDHFHTY
jgi:hypothetical protein